MLPLHGITVVALEQAVAAPFATRQLADLGARVIKVERPEVGDFARGYDATVHGQASYFVWLNRGKESLALDLKDPAGRDAVLDLLRTADVFIQNLAPGAAERLGLGVSELRIINPRLITCSLSGYGDSGPLRTKKAYDLLVQCEAGALSVTGTGDSPAKVGFSVADISAGMYVFSGVLTALYEREQTGVGSDLSVSMLDALGEWLMQPYYYAAYGQRAPERTGARHSSIAPYGPYRVGGGDTVFIGIQNDREWESFCTQILGRTELVHDLRYAHNTGRVKHDDELTVIIETALSGMSANDVERLLDDAGIANARLRSVSELADHPQMVARGRWRMVRTPGGEIRAPLPPVASSGWEAAMGAVPALGEHTKAILDSLATGDASAIKGVRESMP